MEMPYHSFETFKMALGWKIVSLEGVDAQCYCLGGSLFGFAMYIGYVPEKEVGVVILANQGDFDLSVLGEEILCMMNLSQ